MVPRVSLKNTTRTVMSDPQVMTCNQNIHRQVVCAAMNEETIGPRPVPKRAAPEKSVMAVFRSLETYRSDTTPPTMVEKDEEKNPVKKRATSIPGYEWVTAQHIWRITYMMPVTTNTGRRPLISLKGARTIGATAKPVVKVVTPTSMATWETCHSASI